MSEILSVQEFTVKRLLLRLILRLKEKRMLLKSSRLLELINFLMFAPPIDISVRKTEDQLRSS